MNGKRILVIDDEKAILDALKIIMEDLGHTLEVFQEPELGLKAALSRDYDLIITDLRMPGTNGAEIVKRVRQEKPNSRILIITAYPGDQLVGSALKAGARGVLKKPFEIAKILDILRE